MSILRSRYEDTEVISMPFHVVAYMRFEGHGEKIALVDPITGKQFTYKDVITITHNIASGLTKLGLKKGDVVSMYSYNTIDWVFMFWGVICAGGTVTTVNPSYTKYELLHHLKDSGAKFLYTVRDMLPIAKQASKDVSKVQRIICSYGHDSDCVQFDSLLNDDGSLWPELEQMEFTPKEDVAVILYSSGTTGVPKGVLITHFNIMAIFTQAGHPDMIDPKRIEAYMEGQQDVVLTTLPFYHTAGLIGSLILVMIGGGKSIVLQQFEPRRFLEIIQQYKVNYLPLVPPLVIFLAKSPLVDQYDLSSVERASAGAAPLSKDTEKLFVNRLKIQEMRQAYGMTETTLIATAFSYSTPARLGSCGELTPMTEAKVRSEHDPPSIAMLLPL